MQIGGVFIRIYNEMPTFPIMNPKQFTLDLLEYLKQAFNHLMMMEKCQNKLLSSINNNNGDKLKRNKLQTGNHSSSSTSSSINDYRPVKDSKIESTFDEVLNAYNRSKTRKMLENNTLLEQQQLLSLQEITYTFSEDRIILEQNITMVLKALVAIMKSNTEVEIQCIGHFQMLFGFLSDNILKEVNCIIKLTQINIVYHS